MTTRELIAKLSALDPDCEVVAVNSVRLPGGLVDWPMSVGMANQSNIIAIRLSAHPGRRKQVEILTAKDVK